MAVGLTTTKAQVDDMAGTTARAIKLACERTLEFKQWLDAQDDPTLAALGYSVGDIANLRSAYGDLAQFAALFDGVETLATAKDFRVFAQRVWGLGVLSTTT
jgi:hypothetical protein